MRYVHRLEVRRVRERVAEYPYGTSVRSSRDVGMLLQALMGDLPIERMVVVHLNAQNAVMGYEIVGQGGVTQCAAMPCDVFRGALLSGAVSIVLAHNHPSGNPDPSPEDHAMTRRLAVAGRMLGINVLDHIVVGDGATFSFLDMGVMPK